MYLGALVAYPLSPHCREVWNRQGQVTLRVANPVVGHSVGSGGIMKGVFYIRIVVSTKFLPPSLDCFPLARKGPVVA